MDDFEMWRDLFMNIWKGFKWLMWNYFAFLSMLFFGAVGILFTITIVGWPYALRLFNAAVFLFTHDMDEILEGKVYLNFGDETAMNIIWCCTFAPLICFVYLFVGICLCITIICIPFGITYLKMAKFSLAPFSAELY